MKAVLALEDGTYIEGKAFGAEGQREGEVVFNTSMTGYQEIMTDPSYAGQIVVMTYPLIGNYGFNREDAESTGPKIRGLIIKELCTAPSSWRSEGSLEEYMKEYDIIGIQGVDTRAVTRKIREKGTLKGIISTGEQNPETLVKKAKEIDEISDMDLVREVTCLRPYFYGGSGLNLAVIDMGVKESILRSLAGLGLRVTVFPAHTSPKEILSLEPEGILISNGPGDPKKAHYAVETTKELIKCRIPIMGICLGHQILALAVGGDTYKLKFGHRGGNHPVKDVETGRVYITSQNHGFAVREDSLPDSVYVSHINLNDGTIEGMCHKELPVMSVQYHPEASPGPTDSMYLFNRFKEMMGRRKHKCL